jgi:membrane-associated phospholipid phosphatase
MVAVACDGGKMISIKDPRWFFSYGFIILIVSIVISYFWIDIPLVNWAHAHHLRDYHWLRIAQKLPNIFPWIAIISIAALCLRSYTCRLGYHAQALLYTSLAYVIGHFYSSLLKIIFARTWPQTWVDNNPSWITDGVYGFFWFRDDSAYQSFPSGHTTAIFAVSVMLVYFYPRTKVLSAIACALVVAGLISNYYHFLSDIMAGAYLGISAALFMIQLQKKSM